MKQHRDEKPDVPARAKKKVRWPGGLSNGPVGRRKENVRKDILIIK